MSSHDIAGDRKVSSLKSEKLEQLTKEREMTVGKTVPGTQLLLYSAAVLVVAPLLLWMLYLFWLVWMRLFWLVQFSLEFFFFFASFTDAVRRLGNFSTDNMFQF